MGTAHARKTPDCPTHGPWTGGQKHCPQCNREHRQEWLDRPGNRERVAEQQKQKRLAATSEQRAKKNAQSRARSHQVKVDALTAYGGPRCVCCGEMEIDFLSIDHIEDDGAAHRREIFGTRQYAGEKFYRWLRRNGYPPGFQVLCFNCNYAKSRPQGCPHQRQR